MMHRFTATREVIAIFANPANSKEDMAKKIHKLFDKVFDSAESEIKNLSKVISEYQKENAE